MLPISLAFPGRRLDPRANTGPVPLDRMIYRHCVYVPSALIIQQVWLKSSNDLINHREGNLVATLHTLQNCLGNACLLPHTEPEIFVGRGSGFTVKPWRILETLG